MFYVLFKIKKYKQKQLKSWELKLILDGLQMETFDVFWTPLDFLMISWSFFFFFQISPMITKLELSIWTLLYEHFSPSASKSIL